MDCNDCNGNRVIEVEDDRGDTVAYCRDCGSTNN